MSIQRILITGASGFLGQALMEELLTRSPKSALFSVGRKPLSRGGVQHHLCDLNQTREVKRIIAELKPNLIFHLSGLSRVSTEIAFEDYFEANYLQTQTLLESIESVKQEVKLLLASSVHVYGNQEEIVTEESPVKPQSSYAFTKFLAEESLKTYSKKIPAFKGIIARLNSCIGPKQPLGFVASDLCHKLKQAISTGADTLTVGPLNANRYFVDSRDVVKVFVDLMFSKTAPELDTYNIGSLKQTPIREVLEELLKLSQAKLKIESKDSQHNNFLGLTINNSKFQKALPGFQFRTLAESLKDMWQASN
ncbi:MAG: NAD-dependent epimerase/dehydratase family protein [Proteobacteria bacterium]|nr:NAD-dependent epimerase/dehydratase family protein [Pseudomonadota bacterium]NDC25235.1 NAD-dependent epimerase/dehydratase family protein [Pseudomonadota bacterium]NDD05413.1 NAD-dependent epimerase/dehydratase family protein [Pseudomonadota bacterium]NDG27910.1 NAD-dependent epimerase/dehydratase family protein [Pseudomonadota bacterium]